MLDKNSRILLVTFKNSTNFTQTSDYIIVDKSRLIRIRTPCSSKLIIRNEKMTNLDKYFHMDAIKNRG
jgi:hypothetical protein